MGNRTPITELNIEELSNIVKATKQEIENSKIEMRNEQIKFLNSRSLYELSNNVERYIFSVAYKPYIFDFGYILERLKKKALGDENKRDKTYEESLRIRIDVSEQISKMKEIPAFDTECHIESNNINKCTNIKSFIYKRIFGHKKYRLVFHNKKMDYDIHEYIKSKKFSDIQKIALFEGFLLILSIILSNVVLSGWTFFAILSSLVVITINYIIN